MKCISLTANNVKKLSKVIHAASKDELKPSMNCVLFEVQNDSIRFHSH